MQELLSLVERNEDRSFLERAQEGMREWWDLMEQQGTTDAIPMKPQVIQWHLPEVLADDAIVCADAGTMTIWQGRMKLRGGQHFSFSGTNCSMAAALPYAIGAQVAHPDRQVVAFTGDGCMSMLMGDLATLAQHNLPVKVVVINNHSLSLIVWEQLAFLGNQPAVRLRPLRSRLRQGRRGVRPEGCPDREPLRVSREASGGLLLRWAGAHRLRRGSERVALRGDAKAPAGLEHRHRLRARGGGTRADAEQPPTGEADRGLPRPAVH